MERVAWKDLCSQPMRPRRVLVDNKKHRRMQEQGSTYLKDKTDGCTEDLVLK